MRAYAAGPPARRASPRTSSFSVSMSYYVAHRPFARFEGTRAYTTSSCLPTDRRLRQTGPQTFGGDWLRQRAMTAGVGG